MEGQDQLANSHTKRLRCELHVLVLELKQWQSGVVEKEQHVFSGK